MISLTKFIAPDRPAQRASCESIADALAAFAPEDKLIVVRCETDEECVGHAVLKRSMTAVEMGAGDTVWIWGLSMEIADAAGWRLRFEQQQARQAMAALSGSNGFHGQRRR